MVQALWLVSASGGEPQRLTRGRDDYDAPRFRPDGGAPYAMMTPTNERTFNNWRLVMWSWPASGVQAPPQVVAGGAKGAVQIAATWESAVSPAEVGRIDPATGRWTPLTRFNAERAARIEWQPLREFWFTSGSGKRIHSYVALHPRSTRPMPTRCSF